MQTLAEPTAAACKLTDEQFTKAVTGLRAWPDIHSFYGAHFPQCPDDGFYAEGYSELIVRTLATNWRQLDELAAATRLSPPFKAFVLTHIDASTNPADLRAIRVEATSDCPEAHAQLCLEIARAATAALKEAK